MGKAVARKTKTKAETVLEAQRALELHVAGVEDIHVCHELGISKSTLYRRIRLAQSLVLDPTVQQYRAEAAARIREARRRVYARLNAEERTLWDPVTGEPVTVAVDAAAVSALVGRLVQLEDVEAKLRGGYAPTKVDHRVTVSDAFDTLLAELNATPAPATRTEARP